MSLVWVSILLLFSSSSIIPIEVVAFPMEVVTCHGKVVGSYAWVANVFLGCLDIGMVWWWLLYLVVSSSSTSFEVERNFYGGVELFYLVASFLGSWEVQFLLFILLGSRSTFSQLVGASCLAEEHLFSTKVGSFCYMASFILFLMVMGDISKPLVLVWAAQFIYLLLPFILALVFWEVQGLISSWIVLGAFSKPIVLGYFLCNIFVLVEMKVMGTFPKPMHHVMGALQNLLLMFF